MAFVKPTLKAISGSKTTTTNSYVTVPDDETALEYFRCRGYKNKLILLKCTLNNLLYSVDVSNDASIWHNKVTDELILTGASIFVTLSEIWIFIRIQVKPNVNNAHGKLEVSGEMSTL